MRDTPVKRANPSGKVVWRARYTDATGKRRWLGSYPTKREAQAAIDAVRGSINSRDTVGGFASGWTRRYPRSPRTNATNEARLKAVLDVPIEGRPFRDWRLDEVRRRHIVDLLDELLVEQARSAGGARGILSVVGAMWEDAITAEVAQANPVRGVKIRASDARVTKRAPEKVVLEWDEMHTIARAAGRYEPMLRMLADTGMRVGELLALRRADQDFRHGIFRVRGTAWSGRVVESSATKRHDRIGPIPPGCLALLREMPQRIDSEWLFPTPGAASTRAPRIDWPSHRELLRLLEGSSYSKVARTLGVSDNALRKRLRAYEAGRKPGDGPTTGGGLMWRYDNFMRDVWRPATAVAGIAASPKTFRHSWVSHLRAAGVDGADLADMAGHSEAVADAVYRQPLRRSFAHVRELIG